jgi:hypothetical protein
VKILWISFDQSGYHPSLVEWWMLIVAGAFLWLGTTFLIDAIGRRRKRRRLLKRLQPYQPRAICDEAERWLQDQ